MILQTSESVLEYLNQTQENINILLKSFNVFGLPKNIVDDINEAKKQIMSFIEFYHNFIEKSASYEAPQDWPMQKSYLDDKFKKLNDKIATANAYLKSVQNTRQ